MWASHGLDRFCVRPYSVIGPELQVRFRVLQTPEGKDAGYDVGGSFAAVFCGGGVELTTSHERTLIFDIFCFA
jgi:hypothetical protein